MSYSYGELNSVAVEQFSLVFENEYQHNMRKLMNTTQEIHGVVGVDYVAKFADAFDLADRGAFHSNIPRTPVQYRKELITMSNKTALVGSDIFEQALVNASELQNLARQSAWALARQQDQVIIDGMVASTPDNTVTAASNLTVDALREAKQKLDDQDVPADERYIIATFSQQRSLLGEEEATNVDYNTIRTLVKGEIDTFYGFKFIWVADGMSTGGLPDPGGVRACYAWHRDSIITPYSIEPKIDKDWLPESQQHILVPKVRLGSKVVRNNGIVKINCTE